MRSFQRGKQTRKAVESDWGMMEGGQLGTEWSGRAPLTGDLPADTQNTGTIRKGFEQEAAVTSQGIQATFLYLFLCAR